MATLNENRTGLQEILNKVNALPNAGESGGSSTDPVVQPLTVTPTADEQVFTPNGFDGYAPVTVMGDGNLTPANIKNGVELFGVTGEYEGEGVELPTLTDPGMPEHVMEGKEYIDQNGVKQTGEFTLDAELTEQDSLISQIMTALEGKAAGGGSGGVIETCSGTMQCNGDPFFPTMTLSYTDKNLELQTIEPSGNQYNFEVVKNTIVFIAGASLTIVSGCVLVGGAYKNYAAQITENDFSINISF